MGLYLHKERDLLDRILISYVALKDYGIRTFFDSERLYRTLLKNPETPVLIVEGYDGLCRSCRKRCENPSRKNSFDDRLGNIMRQLIRDTSVTGLKQSAFGPIRKLKKVISNPAEYDHDIVSKMNIQYGKTYSVADLLNRACVYDTLRLPNSQYDK